MIRRSLCIVFRATTIKGKGPQTGYMVFRYIHLAAAGLALAAASTDAAPPELSARVAAEGPAGCAEYKFLFFTLFRAEIWTDTIPAHLNFGLSLSYRRAFGRKQLVAASITEMARISGRPEASFGSARAELERAMRDVRRGDRYTAWRSRSGLVEFFHNGMATGKLTRDADLFLDIWLGRASRDPEQRDALLGGRCDD